MENFIFSLNVTLPVFIIILLGVLLKFIGFVNDGFTSVADKFVFKIALPAQLFQEIATMDLKSDFSLKFVLFCVAATTFMFAVCWTISQLFIKDKSMRGAFAQASARGSAAILGIAFVQNIYGNSGMTPMMILVAVPLFNIYSVIILTLSSAGKISRSVLKKTILNIIKNPIILGIIAGFVWNLTGIPWIPLVSKSVGYLANTATPIALIVLGASFEGKEALQKLRPTCVAVFLKLVGIPAIIFPVAISLGFTGAKLVAIMIMLASPTTVTCYIMAKNMNNDSTLSASIIMASTILSSITLTFWVFLIKALGYI